MEGWVGPTAGLDAVEKRKNPLQTNMKMNYQRVTEGGDSVEVETCQWFALICVNLEPFSKLTWQVSSYFIFNYRPTILMGGIFIRLVSHDLYQL
jgi:hypothetical protein